MQLRPHLTVKLGLCANHKPYPEDHIEVLVALYPLLESVHSLLTVAGKRKEDKSTARTEADLHKYAM
jgi:hypothetical protein